jgi:hypothetical protein
VSLRPYFRAFSEVSGTPKAREYCAVFLSLGPILGPMPRGGATIFSDLIGKLDVLRT